MDMDRHLAIDIDDATRRSLLVYTIASAGFDNMEPFLRRLNAAANLSELLVKWMGNRT